MSTEPTSDTPRHAQSVLIVRCSVPGAWYEKRIGSVVRVFATDGYGHWTRDTGPLGCSQWVRIEDTEPVCMNLAKERAWQDYRQSASFESDGRANGFSNGFDAGRSSHPITSEKWHDILAERDALRAELASSNAQLTEAKEKLQGVLDERKEIVERIAVENTNLKQQLTAAQSQVTALEKRLGDE